MSNFLKPLLLSLSLSLSILSSAQNITGKILEAGTGIPIEHADVILKRGANHFIGLSDRNGVFSLQAPVVPEGVLIIHHVSYQPDTLRKESFENLVIVLKPTTEKMEEALIRAVRADDDVPATTTLIEKKKIEKINFGQDMPILLSQTPSTVTNSDAGAGVGYTGIRIRGIDPTRVNVTINGIPLNDAESHGVYWVDLPDFASSANSIQIQRGVGTSTNGAAAFGATVNVKTDHIEKDPFLSFDMGYGSFNTQRISIQKGTGVMKNGWGMQTRVSAIRSDGFIDRASSDLRSLFFTAAHYGKRDLLKLNVMLGHERTYQAWYGVPQPRFNQDDVATNEFMDNLYLSESERAHLLNSNYNTYNPYTYENEVDNYDQHHFQAFYNRRLKNGIRLNTGLHYTHGYGYFEQFRSDDDFSTYNWTDVQLGGDTISSGDFIRRRWLDNHFFGGIFSFDIELDDLSLIVGGGLHQYLGQHYGEIVWAKYASDGFLGDRYYDQDATKNDGNLYAKVSTALGENATYYADLQLRVVDYEFEHDRGISDHNMVFFNPKTGATLNWGKKKANVASIMLAIANREPVRDDYQNDPLGKNITSEQLQNIELGNEWQFKNATYNANFYFMNYTNQLVLTGAINDVGDYIRTNVDQSYRMGIELEGAYEPTNKLRFTANTTLSRNKIRAFTEFVDDWNTGVQQSFERENTDIAFSPSIIAFASVEYQLFDEVSANLNWKYVGKQYLDNSQSEDRSLPGFNVGNLVLIKQWKFRNGNNVMLAGQINNLLNIDYAPNGYTFGTMNGNDRTSFNYVFPMAGRHGMLRLKVSL